MHGGLHSLNTFPILETKNKLGVLNKQTTSHIFKMFLKVYIKLMNCQT